MTSLQYWAKNLSFDFVDLISFLVFGNIETLAHFMTIFDTFAQIVNQRTGFFFGIIHFFQENKTLMSFQIRKNE